MKIVKFFNYEGYLIGIILADVIIIGKKDGYAFCLETTKQMVGTDLKAFMNTCVTELIQDLKYSNFLYESSLISQLEELIIK